MTRVVVVEDIRPLHRDLGRVVRVGEKGEEVRRYVDDGRYAASSRSVVVFDEDPDTQHDVPTRFLVRDHSHELLNCNYPGCEGGWWMTDPMARRP